MVRVKIIPKSNRVKNRVKEHGDIMLLNEINTLNGTNAILVKSIKETWGTAGRREQWFGWITENEANGLELRFIVTNRKSSECLCGDRTATDTERQSR